MEERRRRNEGNTMSNKLMNYYQMSASTHATIVIAITFGLFTLLTLIAYIGKELSFSLVSITFISLKPQNLSIPILIVLYAFLGAFGVYETHRWKWYSTQAKNIAKSFGAQEHGWERKWFVCLVANAFSIVEWLFAIFITCAFFGVLLSF